MAGQPSNLKFTCLIPENFQLWERLALMVQRDLAEIGVDMALSPCHSTNSTSGSQQVTLMLC